MNMKYDVFLIGNASMDFIFTGLPRMPLLGEDTLAEGFDLIPGESFTNASCFASPGGQGSLGSRFWQ